MNEASRRTISEERLTKSSGRRGRVLFGLFDRNRKSNSKKKSVQSADGLASEKVGDADKMPLGKFLMIAEENFGGYPSRRVPPKVVGVCPLHDAGQDNKAHFSSPTLVARLMGLEPLPSFSCIAPQKHVYSGFYCNSFEPSDMSLRLGEHGKLSRGEELKKEHVAAEIDKIEGNIRRPVPSNKTRQQKTNNSPAKRSANFTESNTEIMELKQQLRERGRLAMKHTPSDKSNNQVGTHIKTYRGCQNLANDFEVEIEEPVAVHMFNGRKLKPPVCPQVDRSPGVASQFKSTLPNKSCISERNFLPGHDWGWRKQREDADSRPAGTLGPKSSSLDQMPSTRDRVADDCSVHPRESHSLNSLENYVALSRIQRSCNQARTLKSASSYLIEKGSAWEERSLVNERRQNNVCQAKNRSIPDVNLPKQSNASVHNHINPRKPRLAESNSIVQNSPQNEIAKRVEGNNVSWTKDLKVVSFTSSACEINGSDLPSSIKTTGNKGWQVEHFYDNSCQPRKSMMGLNIGIPSQRVTALSGDKLGALLEQKIMELKSLNQDDTDSSDDDDARPGRSSASILEELISSLRDGQSVSDRSIDCCKDDLGLTEGRCDSRGLSSSAYYKDHIFRMLPLLQSDKSMCAASEFSLESDCYGPSPVSILDASFSTDSCMSEGISIDSGIEPCSVFTKDFLVKPQLSDADMDAVDFAISGRREVVKVRTSHILDSISIMYSTSAREVGAVENKPSYASEVISNTETLFGSAISCKSNGMTESSVDSLFLDTLETLVDTLQSSLCCLICPDTSERSQIRRFLFDCMIEHLDLKYGHFFKSGYKTWMKLPLFQTSENLAREVSMDINKWMTSVGKVPDVIMSKEVKQVSTNHTAFDIEVYELGTEIGHALFYGLLNEILMDILSF